MSLHLRIQLAEAEGALMRLVGLVERRGFRIVTLEKSRASGTDAMILMEVDARDPARRLDILVRQIARLFEVSAVFTPEIAAAATPAHAAQRWREACPRRH